ncbi:MAG TPA: vWA domain-containing protein [Myxococcota bacterium]|nr:vWA domain-containing protein [Myxococcota bacterium]
MRRNARIPLAALSLGILASLSPSSARAQATAPAPAAKPAAGPAIGGAGEEQVWIDLAAPIEGLVQKIPVGMVEVSGSTGAGRSRFHDVAIVVDLSTSTRLPSGVDVNGNGKVGKSAPEIREDYWGDGSPEKLCDDDGDTIAAAEIAAVRRLLKLLDPTHTRVALVAFGDKGELVAPLDSTRAQLSAALDVLDHKHGWYGGTNYAEAIEVAIGALESAKPVGKTERKRSILFLSDGYPTMPQPEPLPAKSAIAAAKHAAAVGAHLHSFALGPEAVRGRDILAVMSKLADGSLTEIDRPGDVLFHLPSVELSEVAELHIDNDTTHQEGRAVRLLADGTFDGFAPLQPGRNVLHVTAVGIGGGRQEEHRDVVYDPAAGTAKDVELEVSRLRELLRERTVEVELGQEIQRAREARRARQKELQIHATPQPTAPPEPTQK